jgi:hypothetical protein
MTNELDYLSPTDRDRNPDKNKQGFKTKHLSLSRGVEIFNPELLN